MISTASTASLSAAAAQGLGNRGIDSKPEFLGARAAEVPGRFLIDISRDEIDFGAMPLTADGVAVEEPLGHVPGVRTVGPHGRYHSEFFAARFQRLGSGKPCPTGDSGSQRSDKLAARNHGCASNGLAGLRENDATNSPSIGCEAGARLDVHDFGFHPALAFTSNR